MAAGESGWRRANQDGGGRIRMAAGESGYGGRIRIRWAYQDSGVAECDSASRSNTSDCSGSTPGKEGAPKKFLVNSSRTKSRNPTINIATKHDINANKNR
jgi:hypothetical protein